MAKQILVIDDEENIRSFLEESFQAKGYTVRTAETGEDGLKIFTEDKADIVILDLKLPDIDGLEILKKIKDIDQETQVIMITGYGKIKSAVQAIKLGAYDFISKPFKLSEINIVVENACRVIAMKDHIYLLNREIAKFEYAEMISSSPKMNGIFSMIKLAARQPSTVLITGETGTGKELVAHAIHKSSRRREQPFTTINCTSIQDQLLGSELFGHEEGAFTGATGQKKGLFEYSDGGSVFLDEIGDMPLQHQAQILRVIDYKSFRRVGGNEDIRVDVRIIAATNKNLQEIIKDGKFREDLFYRLNVVPILLPALRERKEDIIPLAYYFINRLSRDFNTTVKTISKEAEEFLLSYDWPGNIRELKNLVERIMLLVPSNTIEVDTLNYIITKDPAEITDGQLEFSLDDDLKTTKQNVMEKLEKKYLVRILEKTRGNIAEAARQAGVNRSYLYKLIDKYQIRK